MHIQSGLLAIASASLVACLPREPPTNGENGQMGGVFGMGASLPAPGGLLSSVGGAIFKGLGSILPNINIDPGYIIYTGSEYPKGKVTVEDFYSPGTGPYPAHFVVDPSLPNHVIYAPKEPPPGNLSMPVFLWANGGCASGGTPYGMFLTEIASHGYLAIADGPPGGIPPTLTGAKGGTLPGPNGEDMYEHQSSLGGFSRIQDMLDAQEWAVKGNAAKYGNIDINSFITGGSSCGGLMAYSASYKNPRVKLVGVYNSGLIDAAKTPLLKELTARIAYFSGGPKALEFENSERDFKNLPEGRPAYNAALDTGHLGTFFGKNGGKYANASVDLFNWVFRDDQAAKERWMNPDSVGSLVSQHWNVTVKGV